MLKDTVAKEVIFNSFWTHQCCCRLMYGNPMGLSQALGTEENIELSKSEKVAKNYPR